MFPPPGTRVVQLDIDPQELGRNYPNMVSILGDAKTYAIAPHPWTPTGRDFHSYQRTGA